MIKIFAYVVSEVCDRIFAVSDELAFRLGAMIFLAFYVGEY